MIAIADYGMGNRRSVEKALAHVGAPSVITSDVRDASAIILPGVGAFPEAMRHLELQAGTNTHHMIEACFKAFARALRQAVAVDPDEAGVPSTKGTLT